MRPDGDKSGDSLLSRLARLPGWVTRITYSATCYRWSATVEQSTVFWEPVQATRWSV